MEAVIAPSAIEILTPRPAPLHSITSVWGKAGAPGDFVGVGVVSGAITDIESSSCLLTRPDERRRVSDVTPHHAHTRAQHTHIIALPSLADSQGHPMRWSTRVQPADGISNTVDICSQNQSSITPSADFPPPPPPPPRPFQPGMAYPQMAQYAQPPPTTFHHQQQQQQQQALKTFWAQQMEEIQNVSTDPAEFKNHQLPLARIKKVHHSTWQPSPIPQFPSANPSVVAVPSFQPRKTQACMDS